MHKQNHIHAHSAQSRVNLILNFSMAGRASGRALIPLALPIRVARARVRVHRTASPSRIGALLSQTRRSHHNAGQEHRTQGS